MNNAGSDVRGELYARYVSGFRGPERALETVDERWFDHKYLPLLAGVDRTVPVLDLGCGTGSLLAYLGWRGFSHASGIDISAEQIVLAAGRGVDAAVSDVFEFLDTPDCTNRFGAIFAVDFFEHFTRDELPRLARAIHAALRPGGRLVVQTANGAGLSPGQVIYGDLTHSTIFTPGSLAQLLTPIGFIKLAFRETGPAPIRLRGKLDVTLWAVIKAIAARVRYVETGKRQTIWTENFICLAFKR